MCCKNSSLILPLQLSKNSISLTFSLKTQQPTSHFCFLFCLSVWSFLRFVFITCNVRGISWCFCSGHVTTSISYPNNINQYVSNRYLCHMREGCLWSQPSLPGHGETVSHKLLHLLLLWWVKHSSVRHHLQMLYQLVESFWNGRTEKKLEA